MRLIDQLFQIPSLYKKALAKEFRQRDITLAPTHLKVMRLLQEKQPCSAHQLAEYLDRDKAQVTRLLQELLKRELLQKTANPADKRSQWLSLTTEGERQLREMQETENGLLQRMGKDLNHQQIAALQAALQGLAENLQHRDRK